jgi:hypothetical protein
MTNLIQRHSPDRPVSELSTGMKTTSFRWSADKQLRDAVCDFAADSRFANPWAAHLYQRARSRGHRHPHAVRIVARAWLHVICGARRTTSPTTPPTTAYCRQCSTSPSSPPR